MELMLAPMAGYTDIVYRSMCMDFGCDQTITEMVSAKALYYKDKKTLELMKTSENEKNVHLQIFGYEEDIFKIVAKEIPHKYNYININMGCPAPKIVKNFSGSYLLNDPEKCRRLIYALKSSTDIPVSIKIRRGINDGNQGLKVAKIAEEEGASMVIVHGRTKEEYYSGLADWDFIEEVAESLSIPVIGNGDITDYDSFLERTKNSKVDGVAIGRGAIGNPFIFKEIKTKLRGEEYIPPTDREKLDTFLIHLGKMLEVYPKKVAVNEMRKQFVGYSAGIYGSKELRHKLNTLNEYEDISKMINDHFK